eukprot:CAMPEP_0185261570 /NCGR_PEP_ID=MMETSP1359-20130426/9928_1 /TAXON_ID=552665 /ORGANISM="Bigelowiella longifila, Strain CCMP242" /LENGTH=182 /DNA_ID=CAMNT_0027848235 /DNA_START=177 /DNA_END=725 /DNA_ORIENTATION=+
MTLAATTTFLMFLYFLTAAEDVERDEGVIGDRFVVVAIATRLLILDVYINFLCVCLSYPIRFYAETFVESGKALASAFTAASTSSRNTNPTSRSGRNAKAASSNNNNNNNNNNNVSTDSNGGGRARRVLSLEVADQKNPAASGQNCSEHDRGADAADGAGSSQIALAPFRASTAHPYSVHIG